MCRHVVVNGGFNVEGERALKYRPLATQTSGFAPTTCLMLLSFSDMQINIFAACPVKMGEVMFGKWL
jgi:hypothetical protein